LEALERRVIVKSMHIQQAKLEIDGGAYYPKEQLEEVGVEPTQEDLKELIYQRRKLSNSSVMRLQNWSLQQGGNLMPQKEEDNMGDRYDLPFHQHKEEMQQSSLHERRNQLVEQLEEVIEEVRELMLRSTQETSSKEKLSRRKPAREAGKQQHSNKEEEQEDNSKGEFGI
jgi:hypothetical protein